MKQYVLNKDIFKNRLAVGAMYVAGALIVLNGFGYMADRRAESRFDDNKEEVVELIDDKQFEDARALMHDYNYADELRNNDFISLNHLIEREQRKYDEMDGTFVNLDKGIKDRNMNKAWTAFKELKEMDALNNQQEDSLKILLYTISDTRLLNKYAKGDPKQKLEFGEEYLKSFPEGSRAFEIANYVIGKRADVLLNNIVFEEKPSRVLEDYQHLNDALKIKIDGVNVKRFISAKGLDSLTNKYIDEKTYEKLASELRAGDWAVVLNNDINWESEGYINDRRKLIELGKRGKVIDFIKKVKRHENQIVNDNRDYSETHDQIFLQFPKIDEIYWSKDWESIKPYTKINWDNDIYTRSVAAFLDTEVKGIPHMSSSQVHLMKKHLETTKKLIENYVPKEEIMISDSLTVPSDSLDMPVEEVK
jgi:hypothetical protein